MKHHQTQRHFGPVCHIISLSFVEGAHTSAVYTSEIHPCVMNCHVLQATCSQFWKECRFRGFECSGPPFKLSYDTNIPRQAGLSGSSAIVCGAFNCLLNWYRLEDGWPMRERPQFILDVEVQELKIAGGLMDRVAQVVYGGTSAQFELLSL
jgi:galactokinase/mevalonate kinase-like predicted kinase